MQFSALAFLCGVLLTQRLATLPDATWTFLLILVPPAIIWFKRWRPVWFFMAGFLWTVFIAQGILAKGLPSDWEGRDLWITGVVASIPTVQTHRTQFEFVIETADLSDGNKSRLTSQRASLHGVKLLLSWYQSAPAIEVGERWRLKVRLKLPHGFMNPGGFDYEAWLFQKRIQATGYVVNPHHELPISGPINQKLASPSLVYWVDRQRAILSMAIDGTFTPTDNQTTVAPNFAGMIKALAIGEKQGISQDQWQVLLRTGTNHLMAISGLHIGLIAGLMFFLVRWLWSRSARAVLWHAAPKVAAVAAILAAAVYAAMAGFAIPTQRALVMVLVVMLALLWQRQIRAGQVLSLALLTVLIIDPFAVMAAGFWLSFAAVAIIVYGALDRSGNRSANGSAVRGFWWRWGRVQWLLLIGLTPLILFYFQRVAIMAPLANIIAVPWMSFVTVPITLLGTSLLSLLPAAGEALLHLAAWSIKLLWPVLEEMSSWRISQWTHAAPPIWTLLTSLVGVLWLLAPKGFPARWVGVIWLLPLALLPRESLPTGEFDFSLLDVGQGLAAVIQTRDHVLVYDTGPRLSEDFDTGLAVLVPYLQNKGIAAVDTLIVSHGDNDHIGGANSLAEQIQIRSVLSSVPQRLAALSARACQNDLRWEWDGVQFELLHPDHQAFAGSKKGNNRSCVLKVSTGSLAVLLPGDIESAAEGYLLRKQQTGEINLKANILVAPHHGSLTSSSEGFIRAVNPQYVLFPVGYRNRYGFPKPAIVERYLQLPLIGTQNEAGKRRQNVTLFDSAQHGAIKFRVGHHGRVELVQTYRQAVQRYWHNR